MKKSVACKEKACTSRFAVKCYDIGHWYNHWLSSNMKQKSIKKEKIEHKKRTNVGTPCFFFPFLKKIYIKFYQGIIYSGNILGFTEGNV